MGFNRKTSKGHSIYTTTWDDIGELEDALNAANRAQAALDEWYELGGALQDEIDILRERIQGLYGEANERESRQNAEFNAWAG